MEYAIVFLPLLGSIISGFFGYKIGNRNSQLITSFFVSVSAILSLFIFYKTLGEGYSSNKLIFNWISSGNFNVNWSIYIDPLTSVMLVVVSFISALIHFYSIGYMSHDPHKPRFMSYLSLFTFSMLINNCLIPLFTHLCATLVLAIAVLNLKFWKKTKKY